MEFIYTGKLDCVIKGNEGALSNRGEALVEMASRYGLDGIVKLSLEQCSRTDEADNNSDKHKSGRKSKRQRGGLRSLGNDNKVEKYQTKETSFGSLRSAHIYIQKFEMLFEHAKNNKITNPKLLHQYVVLFYISPQLKQLT